MNHIYRLTWAVIFYGVANGLLVVATPQAVLALGMTSRQLGLIGAGIPLGYALSCLLLGRFSGTLPAKSVLSTGALLAALGCYGMSTADSVGLSMASQALFGIAGGAVWPFASSWMLAFESQDLPRTAILRFYNVGWTSGTALGMYAAGEMCTRGLVALSLQIATGCAVLTVGLGLTTYQPPRQTVTPATNERTRLHRIGIPLLLAAILCNLVVLATRTAITWNYAELNRFMGLSANRMGILVASGLLAQLFAFLLGRLYEPLLGRRRVYLGIALVLITVNLLFAYCSSLFILVPAMAACGAAAAVAFQAGILAATEYFSTPRQATTLHEAIIGIGSLAPFFAGLLAQQLKEGGVPALDALRAPFLMLSALIAVAVLIQVLLVSRDADRRVLLQASS